MDLVYLLGILLYLRSCLTFIKDSPRMFLPHLDLLCICWESYMDTPIPHRKSFVAASIKGLEPVESRYCFNCSFWENFEGRKVLATYSAKLVHSSGLKPFTSYPSDFISCGVLAARILVYEYESWKSLALADCTNSSPHEYCSPSITKRWDGSYLRRYGPSRKTNEYLLLLWLVWVSQVLVEVDVNC